MPLDDEAQAFIDRINNGPPIHELGVETARMTSANTRTVPGPEVQHIEDRRIPSVGGEVAVRIYRAEGDGPLPALVSIHGGGFVMGSVDTIDGHARRHSVHLGCIVVSVDYRLPAEAKFPVPLEDCYAAARWIVDQADLIGADANRIAVLGESTGGNLARQRPCLPATAGAEHCRASTGRPTARSEL